MTMELLIKGFFALIFSGMFAWVVFDRDPGCNMDNSRQRYLPYISGMLLPLCVLTILVFALILSDAKTAVSANDTMKESAEEKM